MLNDDDDAYQPSFEDKSFYYTVMDNKVYLIPEIDSTYVYTAVDLVHNLEPEELQLESELPISRDYEDLILAMAALEGMQDLARSDKVQLYRAEVNDQLKVLQGYAAYRIQKEGSEVKK